MIIRPLPFKWEFWIYLQKLRLSLVHPMSCELDDIGCTEDKRNVWRQIGNPQLKGRGLMIMLLLQMELGREQGALRGDRQARRQSGQLLLPQEVRQERVQGPVQRRTAAQRRTLEDHSHQGGNSIEKSIGLSCFGLKSCLRLHFDSVKWSLNYPFFELFLSVGNLKSKLKLVFKL